MFVSALKRQKWLYLFIHLYTRSVLFISWKKKKKSYTESIDLTAHFHTQVSPYFTNRKKKQQKQNTSKM